MSRKQVVKNGQVAVLCSADYGGGWSSPDAVGDIENLEARMFCPRLVKAILKDATTSEIAEIVHEVFPEWGSVVHATPKLKIEWVPLGALFQIREYDGWESVEVFDKANWIQV